jgi:hypothetical protein
MPSLYANVVTGNATIPSNNNTSLYNPGGGNVVPINGNVNANNVNVSNNVNVGGQISAVGDITTDGFFIGNGSQLTGIVSTYGNANVASFLPTYTGNLAGQNLALTGTAVVSGNITSGGYYFGDGSQLTNLPAASYGNANVAAFLPTYSGNISAGNIDVALAITGSSLAVSSTISATGDISTSGNLRTLGAQGNIVGANYVTAGYFVGDGSLLTNVTATSSYSNSNVTSLMAAFGSNTISTTGNITSGYLFGNGSQLTGIAASYSNANVATFLADFGSNTVSTTGNITASYFIGNGSQLTGLPDTYSNANVTTLLANFGSNTVSTTGNITAGYFSGNGSLLTNITGANITGTVANATYAVDSGHAVVSDSANSVAGGNIIGSVAQANYANIANSVSGSNVSGSVAQANYANTANAVAGGNVSGQVANALVAGTVYTAAQPNITSVGTLTSLSVTGNINSGGNIVATTVQATSSAGLSLKNSAGTTQAIMGAGGGDNFAINVSTNINGANAQIDISPTGNSGHVHIKPTGTPSIEIAPTYPGSVNNMVLGNVTPAAATVTTLSTTGNITAAGILTDGYYYANGTPVSFSGTYGNSNVVTLLANFGSNTISTTGNVTVSNLNMSGQIYDSSGVLQLNGSGNIVFAPTGTTVATGDLSATGNITGSYFLGNGSQLTGISASPGGSNTQLQFNNGGVFAGNAAMTFNNTTGNITLGNIVVNTNQIETVGIVDLANANIYGTTTPWRVLVGDAYNGTANSIYSGTSPGTIQSPTVGSRLMVSDFVTIPNTGLRFQEQTNYVWANLSANIANTGTRLTVARNEMVIGGGTSGYGITATNSPTLVIGTGTQVTLGAGTNANLSLIGNIVSTAGATGTFSGVTVSPYSSSNVITAYSGQITTSNANTTAFGNATTQIGYTFNFNGAPANANITGTTTAVAYYMPGATANSQVGGYNAVNGNIARQSTNYYSFRSDDTLAKAQLGSLSSFNEFTGNITSSGGALTVDKSTAQVQQIYLTEAVTSITFSNFVTRVQKPNASYANQSDTVTLIIQQGATPYAVTMPSGTAYRYAGGANIVGSTANTTTMISITGTYNYNTAADQYLITISPEFS